MQNENGAFMTEEACFLAAMAIIGWFLFTVVIVGGIRWILHVLHVIR